MGSGKKQNTYINPFPKHFPLKIGHVIAIRNKYISSQDSVLWQHNDFMTFNL